MIHDMIAPSAAAVPTRDSIELACRTGEPPLRIAASSGLTYCVTASDPGSCRRLAQDVLAFPAAELVPHLCGLLVNLPVLENVVLPAVYHRRVDRVELADRVYKGFEACGVNQAGADVLCERAVASLDEFERRLVAVVRSLLMRPTVLVMERIFEGLTTREMERVAEFGCCYRRVVPDGTLLYLDVAGMPGPAIAADVHAEA